MSWWNIFFLNLSSVTYAINWDNLINEQINLNWWFTSDFVVPTWYDLYIENIEIRSSSTWWVDLTFTDSWSVKYIWNYENLEIITNYWIVFNETLSIENTWLTTADIFYVWYLFQEWTEINNKLNDTIIWENGAIKQEYEFLRQNELFNFYKIEFTALLLLTLVVFLRKITFRKKINFKK